MGPPTEWINEKMGRIWKIHENPKMVAFSIKIGDLCLYKGAKGIYWEDGVVKRIWEMFTF